MCRYLTLVALFLLISCQPNQISPPPPEPTPVETSLRATSVTESGPHLLLSTTSSVQLIRDIWPDFRPVAFGTVLYPTDLLKVDNEVRVLCVGNELRIRSIPAGTHRVPCPPENGILSFDSALFGLRPRGAIIENVPFTLYPRNTLLLDDKPTLYWNDTGTSSYTVILTHQRQPIWAQENVVGNSLTYPAGESPLETGKDYRFEVIDNDSQISSRQDEPAGTGFRLATEEEQAEIKVGLAKITSVSELTGPDRDFALAVYYAGLETSPESGFSPLGEAWLLLKALAKTHEAPMIQLWYGDVLNRLILPNESAKAYEQALERAQQLGDLETQAAASRRLWCLTDEINYYNEAVRLCEELSDQAQVEILRQGDREVICK